MKSDKFPKARSNEVQRMEQSHVFGETRARFMAFQMSLDSEERIVVNTGRRTFQGEETRESRYGGRETGA